MEVVRTQPKYKPSRRRAAGRRKEKEVAQQQRTVPLILPNQNQIAYEPLENPNGYSLTAVATGNNAAWNCPYAPLHARPLIGRSDDNEIQCPTCGRRFRVIPEAGPLTRVDRVVAIA